MHISRPLAIARKMVTEAFVQETPTTVVDEKVLFSLYDHTGLEHEGIIFQSSQKNELTIGLMPDIVFKPWPQQENFFGFLEWAAAMHLSPGYGEEGGIELYKFGTSAGFAYEAPIPYKELDDRQCYDAARVSFIRCLRALRLINPVLEHVSESENLPNAEGILRIVQIAYGQMEIEGFFSEAPPSKVQLPPGLYGGIGTLRPQ